jgi:hypothetical protein
MKGRFLIALLALVALAGGATAASAVPFRLGNLAIDVEGAVTPEALPAGHDAPISFQVASSLAETAGGPLPITSQFVLDADKQGRFFTHGLPSCTAGRLRGIDTQEALRACGPSLVGRGTTSAELHFAGQGPYIVHAPLLMFYGGSPGRKVILLMHVYATQPVPTTFVVRGVVSPGSGPYGTHTVVDIPKIAGGNGSLRSFSIRIHRTWTYAGKSRSFLIARCQTGHYVGRAELKFTDDTLFQGTVIKKCRSIRG